MALALAIALGGCTTPSSPGPASPSRPPAQPTSPSPGTSATSNSTAPGHPQHDKPSDYHLERVVGNLEQPVYVTQPPGDDRLFVVQRMGSIRIIEKGRLLPHEFLSVSKLISHGGAEQGLLSLAFHPNYDDNGIFYVSYTGTRGQNVLAQYVVSKADPNRADPQSARIILQISQPFANHNGGLIAFGPHGYLYMGVGDGGSAGDPRGNGQNRKTLLGAILRLDVDGGDPYGIPADNPFVDTAWRSEIWAFGLRNPWRFSFDRDTGDLYIGDVGQNRIEEVDVQPANSPGGINYGWNSYEGRNRYSDTQPATDVTFPVTQYTHGEGNCSITGGYVYRGKDLPNLDGWYLFGDYCSGKTWRMRRDPSGEWTVEPFIETGFRITSFGQDRGGELYIIDYAGNLYRLRGE